MEHAGWIVSFRVLALDGLGNESLSPGIGPYYCAAGGTSTVAIAADMLIYLAPAWGS